MRCLCLFLGPVLAGCSGGSDGGSGVNGFAAHDALLADIGAMNVTPADQLPPSGSVAYAGSAVLNLPMQGATVVYLGDLTISVDFDSGPAAMGGSLSGLRTADGDRLDGTLTIADATFDPNADPDIDYQFRANVDGTLSRDTTDYLLDGSLAGDYRGPDAAAMAGVIFGDVDTGTAVDIFDGSFAARANP